jgi:hypothetical protein
MNNLYSEEIKQIQSRCRNKYGDITHEEAMQYVMPFGKYKGMYLQDLLQYDPGYFSYMRQQILRDRVSTSLITYNLKTNLLLCMEYVIDQNTIEKWGEEYERQHIRNKAYCSG